MTKKKLAQAVTQALSGPSLHRAGAFEAAAVDEENRVIRVSFSSEAKDVERRSWFSDPWVERLGHEGDEINLDRLNAGAPVLYMHNFYDSAQQRQHIGVVRRAWVEQGRGYAEIQLSKREDVEGIWQDVRDGVLCNVSVGYRIQERKLIEEREDAPDIYRVTRWEPHEISLVTIPADETVGVGRAAEESDTQFRVTDVNPQSVTEAEDKTRGEIMSDKQTRTDEAPKTTDSGLSAEDLERAQRSAVENYKREQNERRKAVRAVFVGFEDRADIQAVRQECLEDENCTPEEAGKRLIDKMRPSGEPDKKSTQKPIKDVRTEAGEDARDKFERAFDEVISVRANMADDEQKRNINANEFASFSLAEFARHSLELAGERNFSGDRMAMVGRAITHGSSAFPLLLANSANKSMLMGFSLHPESYDRWTRALNLSDFKQASMVGLSAFSSLDEIKEQGEYQYGTASDFREQLQLATYGKLFSISRQAIMNDDMNAFIEIPRKMGAKAREKLGDLAFGVLTANANMSDGNALFVAGHGNLASSGGAPSTSTLEAARVAMATQTDYDGATSVTAIPEFALVPHAIRGAMLRVVTAEYEDDGTAKNSRRPNIVNGLIAPDNVIADRRLDADSTTAWYLAANPNAVDTVVMGYLNGRQEPYLEQQQGWSVDGAEFKVRIDAVAKAADWRGLYKNAG